jgi:hypothetical protein
MLKDFKDYIKSEIDKKGVTWRWIETPLFTPSDFEQSIEEKYKNRLKFVVKKDSSKEAEIEFIKEEIKDIKKWGNPKPDYDYEKLNFAEKRSGCGPFHEVIEEFKTYYEKYRNYKYEEFYKEFLKKRLDNLQNSPPDKIEKKLTLRQIALKYVYEDLSITENNNNESAKKHYYNSGKKLMQHFTFFYDRNNRKAKPHPSYTIKTLNNKIELFESVIELLPDFKKNKAIDELTILKGFLVDFE